MSYRRRRPARKHAPAVRSPHEAAAPEPGRAAPIKAAAKPAPGQGASGRHAPGQNTSGVAISGIPAAILRAAIIVILAVNAVFGPPYRLLLGWAAQLRLMRRFEAFVAALPPYAILAALAAPFAFAEPAKIYALLLFAQGSWIKGAVVMTLAYALSLIVLERGYSAGREKLRRIGWFARVADFAAQTQQRFYAFARASRAYALFMETKARLAPLTREVSAGAAAVWARLRARFAR
ncbi:hypothetical protein [Methylocella sp.]|uniref:hypothetical protein n=1 Tax=Methylocella sp. TaxID=1978226 RepID=UPI003782DC20